MVYPCIIVFSFLRSIDEILERVVHIEAGHSDIPLEKARIVFAIACSLLHNL
jgi:hypothetical protein